MSSRTDSNNKAIDPWTDLNLDDSLLQNLLDKPLEEHDTSRLRDGEQHEGFDNNVGDTWIYPNNLPCRAYQLSIVQAALYRNTLVVLPTGLGKTFIAAVIMYNMYRWYPRGKVIFMAPTRPLVNQQIEACQKIMPFPKKDTVELTGKLQRSKRTELWKTKRVFFATPQVVQSDIIGGRVQGECDEAGEESSFGEEPCSSKSEFPFDLVKLLVIDEAHKAKGKYAYAEVAQAIAQQNKYFRVLALSATPGRTMEDVAEVCRNLFISHLEVRWDNSIDVVPYIHKRSMNTIVVSLGDNIKEIREELLEIVDPYLRQLTELEMLSGSLININRNFLLFEQKRFRDRSFHNGRHPQHSAISSNFAICISLYHALELLERHGLRVFLNNFEEDEEGKAKFVLKMDRRLQQLVDRVRKELGPNPFEVSAAPMTNGKIAEIPRDLDFGHPKFEKARECLVKHFENNEDSRAIVFCEYRESVMLIYRMLLQHVPLLKPRCFVGQGGTHGSLRALTQKQQIQMMNDFRSGKSNILIATSIGEEGIDVGEVDLIVCFDISTSNPTRFVQRIGRTGRKKNGHVVMLVTEGREQQLLKEVMANKDATNKKLLKSVVVQQALYKHAPRLVPTEFKPKCIQTYVKPPEEEEEEVEVKTKKSLQGKGGIKNKAADKGTQDLRKFFNAKPKELDKEDLEFFELDTKMTQARPGVHTQLKMEKSFDKMKHLFKDLQSPIATQTQKSGNLKKTPEVKKSAARRKLNESQGSSIEKFLKTSKTTECIDLCDEDDEVNEEDDNNLNSNLEDSKNPSTDYQFENTEKQLLYKKTKSDDPQPICDNSKDIRFRSKNPEYIKNINKFLKMTCTTAEVLKRSKITDISYHLKSKEMSEEMKKLILISKPEYIKNNLEQMKILIALQHSDDSNDLTSEERDIREIHNIILQLFGDIEHIENLLQDMELRSYKQKCVESDNWSEGEEGGGEGDSQDMDKFKNKVDDLFKDLGDGKRHDNFQWIQDRLKQTTQYKDFIKIKTENQLQPTTIQESMVYDTYVAPEEEDDTSLTNNYDDYSFTESKYCSQWQDFNKTDIAFKSTPVQGTNHKSFKRPEKLKMATSLLTKLEETKEEYEVQQEEEDEDLLIQAMEEHENKDKSASTNTKQMLNMLLKLEKKIKENSIVEQEKPAVKENNKNELHERSSSCSKDIPDFEKSLNKFEDFLKEEDDEILNQQKTVQNKLEVVENNKKNLQDTPSSSKNIPDFEKSLNKFEEFLKEENDVFEINGKTAMEKQEVVENNKKNLQDRPFSSKNIPDFEKSLNKFEDFLIPEEEDDEDAIFQAAAEAELQFTQNQTNNSKEDKTNSLTDSNNKNDISNFSKNTHKTLDTKNTIHHTLEDPPMSPNKLETQNFLEDLDVTPDLIHLTQSQKNTSSSLEDPDKTPDILNLTNDQIFQTAKSNIYSTAKLTPPSLNSTPDFIEVIAPKSSTISSALPTPPEISIQQELDIDMEAFMEPFPEEQDFIKTQLNPASYTIGHLRRDSFKENLNKDLYTRQSPDLFAEEFTKSPIKPICQKKPSLASKLSSKLHIPKSHSSLNPHSTLLHSPPKSKFNTQNLPSSSSSNHLKSPSSRLPTDKQKHEKSPSLFDMYMKSTKGKGKLPKTLINTSSVAASMNLSRMNTAANDSPHGISSTQQNDSPIVRKRNGTAAASKRKIFDSDSEHDDDEENPNDLTAIEGEDENDSDIQEIAETQGHNESSIIQHRRKRRRFNSFIEHEAGVSGSENSEDEADHTLGYYVHDSVVVASDDEDPDQASTSHMQGMYLQSLKSPQTRRGGFKIPAPRVYNDHSRIFSQAVIPADPNSHYIPDSFVVDEDDSFIDDNANVTEVSMCPLERAEKILKARRRAKRLGIELDVSEVKPKPKRKKKIQLIEDSSSDEFE